jgi:DNA-binding transcriptional MerR regulator
MPHHFSIGQFGKLTGLTARALRIYAQEGLLQPEVVNPQTGYRYYSQAQSLIAERIRLLRTIDMPLEDIRTILSHHDTKTSQTLLLGHKQRIEAQLRCYQEALQTLEDLRARVWPAGRVAYVIHTGPYEPLFHVYQRITRWINEQKLEQTGYTREIYQVGLTETRQRTNLKTEIQFYIR